MKTEEEVQLEANNLNDLVCNMTEDDPQYGYLVSRLRALAWVLEPSERSKCPHGHVLGIFHDQLPECDEWPELNYWACGKAFCHYRTFRNHIREHWDGDPTGADGFIHHQYMKLVKGIKDERIHDMSLAAWSYASRLYPAPTG